MAAEFEGLWGRKTHGQDWAACALEVMGVFLRALLPSTVAASALFLSSSFLFFFKFASSSLSLLTSQNIPVRHLH